MESFLGDIRYGARMLWKARGLTAVAVMSLAVGIGANTAIFSLVNSILLRPRPVAQPDELVELYTGDSRSPWEGASYPSYLDFRANNQVFSGLAGYSVGWQLNLGVAGDVEQVWGEVVSGNYFDVLGIPAERGRTFLPEEDEVPGRNPVVVIGHRLWQRRFQSDPAVIGKTLTLNGQPLTIVGIAPAQYTGMLAGLSSEIWVPAMTMPLVEPVHGERRLSSRLSRWVGMIGRLKPGTSVEQARSRFEVLTRDMQAAHPEEWADRREDGSVRELFVSVLPERQTRVHPQLRAPVFGLAALLFVVVDLVLVMACLNLAAMFFARAVARRSEIAVRLALGAGRRRILRQLLTESVLLSLIAGVAGALVSLWGLNALLAMMPVLPEGVRLVVDVQPDWRVLAYTLVFATATGVLFGLAPALQASRGDMSFVLKDDSTVTARFRRSRARTVLVMAQVAVSVLLLIGAGLVVRSMEKVRPTRLGFSSSSFVVAPLSLSESRYDRRRAQQFFEQLSASVAALPGVKSVSLVEGMPGGFMSRSRQGTGIEGYTAQGDVSLELDQALVGPSYFTNLGYPLVAGRDFDQRDRDGAPCVAMVNESLAHRYLGGIATALGKRLFQGSGRSAPPIACEIVGVVRDERWQTLNSELRPFYWLALLQADERQMTLLAETSGAPDALVPAVRTAIRTLEPLMPVTGVQTLGESFSAISYPFRLFGFVMAACGVMALLLAVVGIYGTVSFTVAQRRREVGIRMALGALHADILRLVLGQGMRPVAYGLGAGLLLSLALTRVLVSLPLDGQLLFGVSATDALTFAGVTLLLGLVALVACYVPALRAARVDPMVTLRNN